MTFQQERANCPLCASPAFAEANESVVTGHKLYQEWMRPTITWLKCLSCSHVYNRHVFTQEGFDKLFAEPALESEQPVKREPRERLVMARLIERAWPYLPTPTESTWLDIGFGNGALVTTAEEFGFSAEGIDARESACKELQAQGYKATHADLDTFLPSRPFFVVSMLDVLEHVEDPIGALRHVKAHLLRPRGILIVSTPNTDCDPWRQMGESNPYWREVEHLHNFSRGSLQALLEKQGFEILRYHVSERYIAGMEIVARFGPLKRSERR